MTHLINDVFGAIRRHFLNARLRRLHHARGAAQSKVDDKANSFRTVGQPQAVEDLNDEWLAAKRVVNHLSVEIKIVEAALQPPMTLRDEIALRAPHQLLLSAYRAPAGTTLNSQRFLVEAAYAYADAFLRHRSQGA